jgi:hypothetical protein
MKNCILLLISAWCFLSCGKKDNDPISKPASTSSVGEISDTTLAGISAFLQSGEYKSWKAEASVHDSKGPHGKVKSFFNPTLSASLDENNATHPKGSIAVKELYSSDATSIIGYALEAKTEEGTGGDTWLWYEGLSPNFNEYYGQGLSTCTGCHSSGTDFVRSAP